MNKYFYKGEKPIYYDECGAHANVYQVYRISPLGVEMGGPMCEPSHQRMKLMGKWVDTEEFERDWKEVPPE